MNTQVACRKLLGNINDPKLGGLSVWTQPNSWHHFMSDHIVTFSVLPLSPERTLLRTKWLVHKDAVEGVDYDLRQPDLGLGRDQQAGRRAGRLSPRPAPAARPTSPARIRSIPRCWSRNSPIGTSAAWRPTCHALRQSSREGKRRGDADDRCAAVVAGTAEDAFASQVTRELPGWDAETDDVLVCRLVRDETHDVKTFVFSAREPRLFRYKPGQFLTLRPPHRRAGDQPVLHDLLGADRGRT